MGGPWKGILGWLTARFSIVLALGAISVAVALTDAVAVADAASPPGTQFGLGAAGVRSARIGSVGVGSVDAGSVCAPVPAGHARCAAEVLRLRFDGHLVRPPAPHVSPPARSHGRPTGSNFRPALAAESYVGAASLTGAPAPQPFTADYLQQAYDLSYLSATGGSSDTAAVVDVYDDPTADADLATFRAANGLPPCTVADGCLRKVNEAGASAPLPPVDGGWAIEEATDLAAVSALCPDCHLLLVEASSTAWPDMVTAMQTAAQLGARQISDSWSAVAASQPPGQLAFPGVAVIAASGDSGYVGSGADYPAAADGVTAAGGTTLQSAAGPGNPRGFTETAWSGSGSGCVSAAPKPAFQSTTGCSGRAYVDVSSGAGGWLLVGGTSLAAPLVAAFEAVTGVDGTTPAWAYADSTRLNDPRAGSNGTCDPTLFELCSAGAGYDGPT